MNKCCSSEVLGSDPIIIKWNVVRGDTSTLVLDFLENDEVTYFDLSDWTFIATAFNSKTSIYYSLDVTEVNGVMTITAESVMTEDWGTDMSLKAAELQFDLQGTKSDLTTVWTPVIGTINVIGDVSGTGVLS